MAIVLSCIFVACDKTNVDDEKHTKQVPVYKGMTISDSFAGTSATVASDDNGNHYGHFKGDHNDRDDEVDQNKPFEDPNAPSIENKANSTLDVVGSAESIYYADKNQNVFITIKLSNPDSYEILSFTLNGKKYSNYMFEDGSDMENLVLKVNVGDVGGIVEYTIDAIKYVDGTEIKDVRMDGNRTVKAGVRASDQTYVNVTNEQKTMTSISFDAQVVDLYSLIEKSGGYAKAVLYDGVNMLTKDIKVGEKTNIVFDNLTPNTVYQYGVVAFYDNLSGNGAKLNTLYKKAVYTDTIVLFKDVQVGKESIEWGFLWNESFANKQMSAISLWQNGAKVKDVETTATRLDGLKSNNEYTLKATYKNLQNQDETIAIEFVTYEKAVPTVEIANVQSTQTEVSFELNVTDTDNVGAISKIELLHGEDEPIVAGNTARSFENLLSNNDYTIQVTYVYDLNDGVGEQQIVNTADIKTKAKAVPTVEITNAQSTQTQVSFELNVTDTDNVGAITKIELLHGNDEPIVAENTARSFENLFSNNDYTVKVTYVYDLNDGVGDQIITVTTNVRTQEKEAPCATINNVTSTQTQVLFELNVTDTDNVGAISKIELLHGEDEPIVAENTARSFENLLSNNDYTIQVTYVYDLNDGVGEQQIVKTADIKTKAKAVPTVEITNVQSTQTQVSFELNVTDTDNVGAITKIELLHGEDAPIVAETSDIRAFENLFSNNDYTVKVTYTYDLNDGVGERQIVKTASIKTKAKAMPSATISNLSSTQSTIECDVAYTDIDSVGSVVEIALYRMENKVNSVPFATHVSFDGLESGKEYKVVVTYKYDLNDGKSEQTATANARYSTLIDSIVVDSLILLNNNVVKLGEELNLRVYFTNSSEIELTGIYVNGQKATVVGGDRIESAIVKFVPTTSGLCKFAIDRVDYVINGIEVNQAIDSNVDVEYPIYRDIDITYTPITISKYENTGDGVYISFDNEDGYTVFKVNESDDFVTVDSGRIFTKDISITSIEYGYADYGHTTQSCDFKNDDWSDSIHKVTALKRIYTVEDFFAMTDGYYLLMNDLDLRSVQTKAQIKLTGIFDANGHTICGLSNVVDTSKYEYFDLFQGGSIYDATFKELYVSINHANSADYLYVRPLGNAKLYNCTVKGDVMLSDFVNYGDLNIVDDSTTYSLNVTAGTTMSTQKYTATNTLAKNTHIVERDDVFYFDCEVGKAFLSYANRNTTDYTVEDGTFFVRSYAFADSKTLRNIIMPESVKRVGNYSVFENCIIENATIPIRLLEQLNDEQRKQLVTLFSFGDGVTSIGDNAFSGCTGLTSITIPGSVTSIGSYAFHGCTGLTSVTIGKGVTSIGGFAFEGCTGLTSITIPDSVTSIDEYAFWGCAGLTSITIPDSVTSIGDGAFSGCDKIQDVYIADIGAWCNIAGLSNLMRYGASNKKLYINNELSTSITIPNGVMAIPSFAFYNCTGLTSVTIPDSVTNIGSYAFEGCTGLTSVTIPDSVTSIGKDAFSDCAGLTSVTIGNSVTSIGSYAFSNCTGLTSVTIGNSVTSIGNGAFYNCTGLTSVTIPDSVTSIGDHAFFNCTGLTSVTIGNSVTSVGENAFSGCTGLTSVTIPDSVTSIGSYAFSGCSSIESITIPFVGAKAGVTSSDTYQYPFGYIFGTSHYDGGVATTQYYYGNSTSSTTSETYYIPSSLKSVTVTGGNILYGAFYGCTGLTSITIPDSVTSIGDYAFYNCSGLTSITIPDGVASIGKHAFYNCSGLTSVHISDIAKWCATSFGDYDANPLMYAHDLYVNGVLVKDLIIPDSVTEIGDYAFNGCSGLTSVTIPASVTRIGNYAFNGCTGLTSATIPASVTRIGNSAFYGCTGLTRVTISKNTTSIGEGAFGSCGNLQYVLYDDTAMSWGQINIESNNDCLMSAKKLYNHDGKTRTYTFVTNSTQENFSMSGLYLDELPVVEKEGYDFCGWYDNQQFDGARITTPYYDGKNTVLYAKWEIIHYTIKYDFGDAMSVSKAQNNPLNPLSYTILDEIEFAKPQRKGYTFVSWDKNILKGTTGEIVVTAQWVVDEYSIEYVLNGWTNSERNKTTYTIEDGNITLYDATHDGSLFCGWYLDEACKDFVEIISADELKNYTVYTNPTNFATAGLSIQNDTITGYNGTEKEVSIPSYYRGKPVLKIGKDAFNSNANIRKVVIPYGITVIGNSAFYCSGLTSLDIPNSVTSIGEGAFERCTELIKITGSSTIASSVAKQCESKSFEVVLTSGESIGDYAFYNCTGLTSITIPDCVTSIGGGAFKHCGNLMNIIVSENNSSYINVDGILYNKNKSKIIVASKAIQGAITVSDSVTSIDEYAFYNCAGLTSIVIPDGVTTIGYGTFCDSGLTSVTIGNSVTSIGYETFRGCTKLTSVTIPDSITSIENYAFYECTGLMSVTIGNGVTSIGDLAFEYCYKLVEVYNKSTLSITAGSSSNGYVAYYSKNVYTTEGGSKLTTNENGYVIYTDGDEKILVAYRGTNTELVLPSYITQINQNAFLSCSGLTSIAIPNSVTSIGPQAFSGCRRLTSINFNGTKTQWNAISKGSDWKNNVPATQVICTDGTVSI